MDHQNLTSKIKWDIINYGIYYNYNEYMYNQWIIYMIRDMRQIWNNPFQNTLDAAMYY